MSIEYDKEVDALYIRIQEKDVARTQEGSAGLNVDFDAEGELIGLEVLGAAKNYSLTDIFNRYGLIPRSSLRRESDVG